MEKRHHIEMNECHAEMLGVNRAEVTTDQIRENQDEFRGLAHKLGIDIDTVAGRRRVGNIDESGFSGTKATKRMTSEKVIMPSCVKSKPIRKVPTNRGNTDFIIQNTADRTAH